MKKYVIGMMLLLGWSAFVACKAPMHLSYDYGRAFQATFPVQADLTRESVISLQHPLGGLEGVAIRLNVTDSSTEGEDATSTLTAGS